MIIIENHCVDCGLPCIGDRCPFRNVEVHYCDNCGFHAAYHIGENHLCRRCADLVLNESWDALSVPEKAETLDVYCKPIN